MKACKKVVSIGNRKFINILYSILRGEENPYRDVDLYGLCQCIFRLLTRDSSLRRLAGLEILEIPSV